MAVLFLGVDWGETHHDLCLLDQDGNVLTARRVGAATCRRGWWRSMTR